MAYAALSEEEKNKVRASVDIVALMGERSPMKQKGRDFWCCCPVHNEKTPSCKVDPVTQLWHCFGCGEGGDVFSYLMKAEGMSFIESVTYLADKAHIELEFSAQDTKAHGGKKQRLKAVCQETQEFYNLQLRRSRTEAADAARKYLAKRDMGGPIPNEWNLGFAPGNASLVRHLQSKGFSAQEMIDANVALKGKDGRLRDRFYDRIMFPICDVAGEVIAFGGRIIGDGQPKYLNSNETALFYKSSVLYGLHKAKASMAATGKAIVCEGYTDVIALHKAGIQNAVATLGTALTKQHIRILSRHAKDGIVYLFDGDSAGQRAAERALQFIDGSLTPEAGLQQTNLYALTLPDNLDPADFLGQYSADALRDLISQAKPLLQYGIERRIEGIDLGKAEGRSLAFQKALEILAPIKDSLLAKDYALQIANMTRTREDLALQALDALKPAPVKSYEEDQYLQANATGSSAYLSETGFNQGQSPEGAQANALQNARVKLSPAELNRRKFECEFLRICTQAPNFALEYAHVLACTQWHDSVHELLANGILELLSENSSATPADIVSNMIEVYPQAGGILTDSFSYVGSDLESTIAYISEELSLGDLEENIKEMKLLLEKTDSGSENAQVYFESIAALQKDFAERRDAHRNLL